MASNNTGSLYSLTTLIKRLEAATSRLEDIAAATIEPTTKVNEGTELATDPETTTSTSIPPAEASKSSIEELPEALQEFDAFITGPLKAFVNLSDEVGEDVAKQAASVLRAFVEQRKFLLLTTKAKKPDASSPVFTQLLSPLQEHIAAINDVRESNRGSPLWNHLSAVSESITVLAWITIDVKPYTHVAESLASAQFWGNRVLSAHKDKDQKQVQWVQAYYQSLKTLSELVKKQYPKGIPWNSQGVSAEEALKQADEIQTPDLHSNPPASGSLPPPPPPPGPPPPPIRFDEPKAAPTPEGGLGAVFSELNKGEAVTKGLRKVNPDEMTHKNPSLRAGATVPTRSDSQSSVSSVSRAKSPAPGKKPKPESMRIKKPPVKKLDGNKWLIENFDNESQPIEIEASISQSILISRCNKTTIMVKGKANAISIDNSPRLSLVVESLVSSIDVIKSSNLALQVLGTLPTVLMDQVDGAQIYLSKESTHTEIFASKSSGVNLNIIDTTDDVDDYKEVPLPEQIRTYIDKDGKVRSEIVEHAG